MKKDYDCADNYTTRHKDEDCYDYDTNCYSSGGTGGGSRLQGNENAVPYAVASVNEPSGPATAGYHYGTQGGVLCVSSSSSPHAMAGTAQHAPTATVEGVLVVAAAPAPAVLASRPYPSNELCHGGMGMAPGGKPNGGMFKGHGGGHVVASTGQGRATKSSRYEVVSHRRRSKQQQGLLLGAYGGGGGGVSMSQ